MPSPAMNKLVTLAMLGDSMTTPTPPSGQTESNYKHKADLFDTLMESKLSACEADQSKHNRRDTEQLAIYALLTKISELRNARKAIELLRAEVKAWRTRADWANAIAIGEGVAPPSTDEAKETALRTMDELLAARAAVDAANILGEDGKA